MNIAVFFGGKNTEHDVSIITGQLVISGLKELGHTVYPVYISKDGKWYINEKMDNVEYFKNPSLKLKGEVNINFTQTFNGSVVLKANGLFSKSYNIDLAFPAIHGKNGEDGTIQGLFELIGIPYVGCDVVSSAISMDKALTKLFYQRFNLPTTKFVYFTSNEWEKNKETYLSDIKSNLTWPVFVKPARLGSSIGMTKVKSEDDLEFAVEVALHYDNKVVVEESVEDLMDITVAVLGNENDLKASLIQESAYSKDFFSYEDKYLNEGGAQLGNAEKSIIIPARLDEKTTQEVQDMALEVYRLMGLSGIARVDFLYNKTYKKYYVNEINTMPGTIYHHLWKKSGVELGELLSLLVDSAQDKYKKSQKLTFTFESSILKAVNSNKLKVKAPNN